MDINRDDLKLYLNISHDVDDMLLDLILKSSKRYIKDYTGATDAILNSNETFNIAIMVLATEMYDNRSYTIQNDKANLVIESILGMHSFNLV